MDVKPQLLPGREDLICMTCTPQCIRFLYLLLSLRVGAHCRLRFLKLMHKHDKRGLRRLSSHNSQKNQYYLPLTVSFNTRDGAQGSAVRCLDSSEFYPAYCRALPLLYSHIGLRPK